MPAVRHVAQPAQWPLYLSAVVDIAFPAHTVRVAPGPAPRDLAGLPHPLPDGRAIHILTAFNPAGRPTTDRANLRAQHDLLGRLHTAGLRWWPAVGGDRAGTHREISAAVTGLTDSRARALGRHFGQDAVFAWSPASWRLLACDPATPDAATADWHATPLPPL
ncbi:DUF3293 domain-containing protein [Streptomyces sp. NPDC002574]|uniref:DUF3293 domain-containing protein n=1 Tax=Streptomyces sp. NPDC002574 TaxID=3364652 RepID=UPI0036C24090